MPAVSIEYETLPQLLRYQVARRADTTFIIWKDQEYTYGRFDALTDALAGAFYELGIRRGDVVSIYLPNCPQFILAWFALSKIGAVMGPINALFKGEEVAYILDNSEAKGIIATSPLSDVIDAVAGQCPNLKHKIFVGAEVPPGWLSFEELVRSGAALPSVEVSREDVASIIYTSGTTGRPKGVLLTHWNYITDTAMGAEVVPLNPGDRIIMILPLFHVNAQVATTTVPMMIGATVVLLDHFNPANFWAAVAKYRPVTFSAVPTILQILLNAPGADTADLSSLRYVICGAAPLPVELFHQFEAKFNLHIMEGYGLTEGTCVSSINPYYGVRKIGSIGLPLRGQEMAIMDDAGNLLPDGEYGEIVIRGPNVMKGYYKNPEATKETIMPDGWLRTGDIGYRDGDGYFWIVDRKKEMIIRGGENIYPREIEEVLHRHPAVAEAAVIGVPSEKYGEEVKAMIVLKPGATATAEEIVSFCRERLADFKVPRYVEFVSSFPKTPTGKIQKKLLKAQQ